MRIVLDMTIKYNVICVRYSRYWIADGLKNTKEQC